MPGESAALVRTWRVGKRKVTVTVPQIRTGQVLHAAFEWSPNMPRRLSRRDLRQYRKGRDSAFNELCRELGIPGALVEI